MDEFYLIRKMREVKALHRVAGELKEYIDERIRQEDAEADALPDDALPDDPKDPAWDDRKFFYLENAHAFRRIENYLLKLQLEKQKELSRLSAAYEYQRKKKK